MVGEVIVDRSAERRPIVNCGRCPYHVTWQCPAVPGRLCGQSTVEIVEDILTVGRR